MSNIATFKTLKPKAAILTAGRGLGYNNDEIQSISDMIPTERGEQWTIRECLEGNEEKERKPIKEFTNAIEEFENLKESALELEGLIVGRSIHASGIYIFQDNFITVNSLMKAPNGTHTTCWSMEDSDYCSALKMDALTIQALDKIRKTMELLLQDGKMQWKGSLKETYNFYLHPDKLEYEDNKMWELLYSGEVINAFQYEGMVGQQALRKIKPTKFVEAVAGNSLMRLSTNGSEQPLDRYVRYKNDIGQWYADMKLYELSKDEVSILEKHLLHLYGIADTQEVVMELSMDSNISNFSLMEANKLRKGISKKKKALIEECKNLFFTKGLENGTRINLLNYVWDEQISLSLGYSFSRNHTNPYTGIMLQEMNLCHLFGSMYWKCGCLSVNAGDVGEGKSSNYGKIAKAVCEMKNIVDYPNINNSKEGFTIKDDRILYGLKAIEGLEENDIKLIINNRPFNSLSELINTGITNKGLINLIKSNSLKDINPNRVGLAKDLIDNKIGEFKKSFTKANLYMLMDKGLIPSEYKEEMKYYHLYKTIATKSNEVEKDLKDEISVKGKWFKIDNALFEEFVGLFDFVEGVDYIYMPNLSCYMVKETPFKKGLDNKIVNLNEILNDKSVLKKYNNLEFDEKYNKHFNGNISKWEMDSINFYHSEHELDNVDTDRYCIEDFSSLPEDPIATEEGYYRGRKFYRYKLSLIMGTVLDRDKTKHTVDVLTPSGVITCKMYGGAFNHYNKRISKETGVKKNGKITKEVLEESWFKRGTKVLLFGYRDGDLFRPRKYKDSVCQHTVMKILDIKNNGELQVQSERIQK